MIDGAGIRFGIGCGLEVLVLFLSGAARMAGGMTFAVLLVTTTVYALVVAWPLAASLGLVSWAFYTGFVTNRFGQLTFAPRDLVLLAVLVSFATWASARSAAQWQP